MGRLAQLASEREIRFSGPGQGRIMGGRTIQGEPMRRMLWALLVLPLAAACAPISVTDDYDTQTDFTKLRTYAWHVAPAGAPAVDSLTQQRIVRAVDDALEAKGFRKADSGTPDFKVHTMASVSQRIQTQPVTVGVGYAWRYGYVAAGEGVEVTAYDEGTLILDVISTATKNLVWRGTARGAVERDRTPEEREARIRDAVFKVIERFPPNRK